MSVTAPTPFDRSVRQIEGMMDRGAAFERVEDAIEHARFSTDHKAALWLFAWSLRDPRRQRRGGRLTLMAGDGA
jgi:hypothetical protein